jgi:hypothetical protein
MRLAGSANATYSVVQPVPRPSPSLMVVQNSGQPLPDNSGPDQFIKLPLSSFPMHLERAASKYEPHFSAVTP